METYDPSSAGSAAVLLAFIGVMLIPLLIISVISIVGQWKVYLKAGQPGWACIVPFYNIYILLKIVGKPGWWLLLYFLPCINIIFAVWTLNLLSKSFGQSEGFTLGLIFLPFIFYPVLGFGSYTYLGPAAAEARVNNFYDQLNNNQPPPPPQV